MLKIAKGLVSEDAALLGRENAKRLANVGELSKRELETALMSSKNPATPIAGFFMSEANSLLAPPVTGVSPVALRAVRTWYGRALRGPEFSFLGPRTSDHP